jgi:hypothetical protein
LLALQPDSAQHRIEQLPSSTDEWLALTVLIRARRFTDHHPFGSRVAHSENALSASEMQWTSRAAQHRGFQILPAEL